MSKPRPNLAEIAAAAGSTRKTVSVDPHAERAPVPTPERQKGRSAGRGGTKQVGGHFPDEVSWQLRQLAVERRSTVQALLGEALNDLFQKHGKPEIVPVDLPA